MDHHSIVATRVSLRSASDVTDCMRCFVEKAMASQGAEVAQHALGIEDCRAVESGVVSNQLGEHVRPRMQAHQCACGEGSIEYMVRDHG
jgi:hypothetical protein